MELKEMIKVMQHYDNGGVVEFKRINENDIGWLRVSSPKWNWDTFEYRIKEQKQKVTIEKWLCQDNQGYFVVIETSDIDAYIYYKKIKLIETYEVEL